MEPARCNRVRNNSRNACRRRFDKPGYKVTLEPSRVCPIKTRDHRLLVPVTNLKNYYSFYYESPTFRLPARRAFLYPAKRPRSHAEAKQSFQALASTHFLSTRTWCSFDAFLRFHFINGIY